MTSRLKPALSDRDHLLGDRRAPIVMCEFGDYQCPYCGRAHGVTKALERALGERLAFAFRHFPLSGAHPHAMLAAEAAEAAGAQGKFWAMHDLLYTHQDALTRPDLTQYALALNLDLGQFEDDLGTHCFLERIRADVHAGALSGVNGTPTFFIDGVRYDGARDFETMWGALMGAAGAATLPG